MEIIILIGKIIGGFLAVMLIMASPWIIMDLFFNLRAKKVITEYCSKNGLTIEKIEIHKNHYGLRFKNNGEKGYVRFRVKRKKVIEWVGNVPEVISQNA